MKTGRILWLDLTVENAESVKRFYEQVAGWTASGLSMGDYEDYVMMSNDEPVAGICHNKGVNINLPPQWLNYITVENLDASIEKCIALGGRVVDGPRHAQGASSFVVIQDPGGAYVALMEQKEE
ncbi:VOC family protein [Danxiaibacter flavus]|uniref:VOC family protein n=1 Tax=Danxiaibacter flavus TaxID=3049108 RepID=A0ABV3ZIF6_9BACT|nr:VOC family protein [Chitinophagaceae bacterium DXS]